QKFAPAAECPAERDAAAARSRATARGDFTRGRKASNTIGAAARWISGAGTNAPNARMMAPSNDSGWLNASVSVVARPIAAFTPQAAIAHDPRWPEGATTNARIT